MSEQATRRGEGGRGKCRRGNVDISNDERGQTTIRGVRNDVKKFREQFLKTFSSLRRERLKEGSRYFDGHGANLVIEKRSRFEDFQLAKQSEGWWRTR